MQPAAKLLPARQGIRLRPAREVTPAHADAMRSDTHGQPLAFADVSLRGGVHGFIDAHVDEMQRAALPLGVVFVPRDVVLRMGDADIVAVAAGRDIDALFV